MIRSDLHPLPLSMHVRVVLLLLLGLLAKGRTIRVQKCCAQYEVLAGDGQSCVESDWGRNASSARRDAFKFFLAAPLDEGQVRPWLPQGLPARNITLVVFNALRWYRNTENGWYPNTARVNSSSLWEQHKPPGDDVWKREVVFLDDAYIARPRPWAGHRSAKYCVDAALPPLQPFLLFFETQCTDDECISKCCKKRQVLVNKDGFWQCENDPEGYWSPIKSSLRKVLDIDPEFPYEEPWSTTYALWCTHHRRASLEDRPAGWSRYDFRHFLFSSWKFCVDHFRDSSALHEGLFYCEHPRIARGIYWLLRPLCVVSALLLAVALLSIACDSGMRRKVHGWCLAHHALCLFGFNVGQVVYYLAISDEIDMIFVEKIPADLQRTCTYLVLSMYFLLTASWFWLTVLCVNMAQGFRLQAAAPKRSGKMKFLLFSGIAWGLPVAMTITCCFLFTPPIDFVTRSTTPWYSPSLMEARMCYNEPFHLSQLELGVYIFTYKSGTALLYYCPVGCLVLCNVVSVGVTLRKVHRLRRGNSVLRREEDVGQRRTQGNPPPAAHARTRWRSAADAKTIKLYLKMLLMTGFVEIVSEMGMWSTTRYLRSDSFQFRDYHFPYRCTGFVADFVRAACVAWLASPEGGYLRLVRQRLRADNQ